MFVTNTCRRTDLPRPAPAERKLPPLENDAIAQIRRQVSRGGPLDLEFESLSENAGDEADPAERGGL